MQRDPKFIKNMENFHGAERPIASAKGPRSTASRKASDAQKLDKFIIV